MADCWRRRHGRARPLQSLALGKAARASRRRQGTAHRMKVTGAKVYLVTIDRLHPVLVEVATDEGITGVGEAAVAYGIGGTAAAGMIRDLVQAMVLGRNPFRIEELWSDMYDHSFWAKGGGSIVFAGMSAIEQALWDIKGKALGIPVYEFLGGKCRE